MFLRGRSEGEDGLEDDLHFSMLGVIAVSCYSSQTQYVLSQKELQASTCFPLTSFKAQQSGNHWWFRR